MEIGKDLLRSRELRKAPQASTDIRPEDSVSNVGSQDGSRLSTRSRASSRSLTRSSSSAKVKAAARRAVLEAEAAALERLYAIQEEELRLQQRKKQLELQTCIDKAEAKEMAYAEAEAQEMRNFYVIDQTGEDIEGVLDPLATSNIDARPQSNATKRNEAQSAATKPNQSYTPRNKNETLQLRAQMLNADAAEWTYNTSNSIPPESMNGDIIAKMLDSQDRQSHALHQLLKQQQENVMALTLPQPDLPVFDGDAIQYCDFIRESNRAKNKQFECEIVLFGSVHVWASTAVDAQLSFHERRRRLSRSEKAVIGKIWSSVQNRYGICGSDRKWPTYQGRRWAWSAEVFHTANQLQQHPHGNRLHQQARKSRRTEENR